MNNSHFLAIAAFALMVAACLGEETPMVEKETDNKATESKQVKMQSEQDKPSEKGKRAPVAMTAVPTSLNSIAPHPKVMVMPPVSLMIAMPHPSGRFLMLFPTTHLVPVVHVPYANPAASIPSPAQDHPAFFAARQQMLYSGPTYQPPRDHYYQPYSSQSFNGGFGQKRMPMDV